MQNLGGKQSVLWAIGKQSIEKTVMVKKKNKDKIFSLKGIYINSLVSEIMVEN